MHQGGNTKEMIASVIKSGKRRREQQGVGLTISYEKHITSIRKIESWLEYNWVIE